ncbi:exodeoxyribonuclease III [Plasmodium falciparum Palo Alto/Uganda]|uniref:DNA-(apurinic or apyrimidinic site) endonuclease n=2 Tax=Plasmodium falciparum TaxID=5833 RepID=W4IRA0_PLAFP|nr:exodeoxyribonuclease III [Plasmodium falciparum Palo Alto/Uganda]ETW63682.1 exodeoxyribonuclease III [Plasmodium falciparum CAMP/Malaysia]
MKITSLHFLIFHKNLNYVSSKVKAKKIFYQRALNNIYLCTIRTMIVDIAEIKKRDNHALDTQESQELVNKIKEIKNSDEQNNSNNNNNNNNSSSSNFCSNNNSPFSHKETKLMVKEEVPNSIVKNILNNNSCATSIINNKFYTQINNIIPVKPEAMKEENINVSTVNTENDISKEKKENSHYFCDEIKVMKKEYSKDDFVTDVKLEMNDKEEEEEKQKIGQESTHINIKVEKDTFNECNNSNVNEKKRNRSVDIHNELSNKRILTEDVVVKCNIKNDVKIIVTWNMNSITVRYKNKKKWDEFMNFFNNLNADVLCFQEVRLPAMNLSETCDNKNKNKNKNDGIRDRGKIKNSDQKSLADYEIMEQILNDDFKDYNAYFSLANIKYSGQLVLVKKNIHIESIRYNLFFENNAHIHHDEGRVILVEFSNFFLLSTYTPNNGFDHVKFERRRLFDEQLQKFVTILRNEKQKPLVWTGDLNIAPEDIDLSHPAEFRRMKKGNVPKEFIGQPGCTDFERKNFQKILTAGNLVDSYRYLQNIKLNEDKKNNIKHTPNINDNIYTWRCPFLLGKSCNKAMRIDHFIVSKEFLNRINKIHIQGFSVFHNNFYGSDHCPVILYLKNE